MGRFKGQILQVYSFARILTAISSQQVSGNDVRLSHNCSLRIFVWLWVVKASENVAKGHNSPCKYKVAGKRNGVNQIQVSVVVDESNEISNGGEGSKNADGKRELWHLRFPEQSISHFDEEQMQKEHDYTDNVLPSIGHRVAKKVKQYDSQKNRVEQTIVHQVDE